MRNLKDTRFSIEKSTLRELTSDEARAVGGGLSTQGCSAPCLPQETEDTYPVTK